MANKICSIQHIGKDSIGKDTYINLNNGEHYVGIKQGLKTLYIQYHKFYKDIYNQEDEKILTESQ